MIELKQLERVQEYFLYAKAERETDFLPKAFVWTEYYDSAFSQRYPIIVGRKGAGKSAILEKVLSSERDRFDHMVRLTSEDFNYEGLVKFYNRSKEVSTFQPKLHLESTWRHVILNSLMLSIVRYYEKKDYVPPEVGVMSKCLTNMGVLDLPKFLDVCNRVVEVFEQRLQVSALKFSKLIKDLFFGKDFDEALDALKKYLRTPKKAIVLIDGLDRELDRYNADPEVIFVFIRALVETALDLQNDSDLRKNFMIKTMIPTDIYNKIKVDLRDIDTISLRVNQIIWDKDSLYRLICRRLIMGLGIRRGDKYSQDYDYAWKRIFPETVENRPRYRTPWRVRTFEYLLRHTLCRPRELITLCNEIFDIAKRNAKDKKVEISSDMINDAINQFTTSGPETICAEYNYRRDGMLNIILGFQNGHTTYTYGQFYDEIETYIIKNDTDDIPAEVIKDLYEMGFIGAVFIQEDPVNPKIRHRRVCYSYTDPTLVNLSAADYLEISHGFHNILQIHE